MSLQLENPLPAPALVLLRHCYCFVNEEWQHLPRDVSPDQGFEAKLRESCVSKLVGWVVSQHREMNLGMGLFTASGVLHEIDIVAHREPTMGILELKNRATWPPEKNDVINFFAKILDYLCHTPALLRAHLVPIFCRATRLSSLAWLPVWASAFTQLPPNFAPCPFCAITPTA
jgi:hypothetical protein